MSASNFSTLKFRFESLLDMKHIHKLSLILGRLVTGMDISSDGKRFVVLTYTHATEFNHDLSSPLKKTTKQMAKNRDYKVIRLKRHIQQEAIAYLEGEPGVIYTTERKLIDPFDPFHPPGYVGKISCR